MAKKITSFIDINNEIARLKIGTVDKKNMKVIFFEGGFYIKPTIKKENYLDSIEEIKKELAKFAKSNVENSDFFKKDFMFFTDIADERVTYNKSSYLTFQLYVKPTEDIIVKSKSFKQMVNNISQEENIVFDFKNIIEKNNFVVSKTKI